MHMRINIKNTIAAALALFAAVSCVDDRNIIGGPAKEAVMASIKKGEEFLGLI